MEQTLLVKSLIHYRFGVFFHPDKLAKIQSVHQKVSTRCDFRCGHTLSISVRELVLQIPLNHLRSNAQSQEAHRYSCTHKNNDQKQDREGIHKGQILRFGWLSSCTEYCRNRELESCGTPLILF